MTRQRETHGCEKTSTKREYIRTTVSCKEESTNLRGAREDAQTEQLDKQCWWNVIYGKYTTTSLNPNRCDRYLNTHEDFLKIRNRTEDDIEEGVRLYEIIIVFTEWNVSLRVIDQFNKHYRILHTRKSDNHYPPLYVYMRNHHIYPINETDELEKKDIEHENY